MCISPTGPTKLNFPFPGPPSVIPRLLSLDALRLLCRSHQAGCPTETSGTHEKDGCLRLNTHTFVACLTTPPLPALAPFGRSIHRTAAGSLGNIFAPTKLGALFFHAACLHCVPVPVGFSLVLYSSFSFAICKPWPKAYLRKQLEGLAFRDATFRPHPPLVNLRFGASPPASTRGRQRTLPSPSELTALP